MRTTALALRFVVAEYASPSWLDSSHTNNVDVTLNETCRKVTNCMRNIPIDQLYGLSGIAPPLIRRKSHLVSEKTKQETNETHPLYNAAPIEKRLKSRISFLEETCAFKTTANEYKQRFWKLGGDPTPPY